VAGLQIIIPPDVQAQAKDTPVCEICGHVNGTVFVGPVVTSEANDAIQTEVEPTQWQLQSGEFIVPTGLDYYFLRKRTFSFCELIQNKFPPPIIWAEASNTTRGLWENWWNDCLRLIEEVQNLPFNQEQDAPIRELNLKLDGTFCFFEQRRQLEASEARVASRTRSGKQS
jgi:hypothetical protein